MTALTLESALALPQAHYISQKEANITDKNTVSVGMDAAAVTNKTSQLPILHTQDFSACMCIAVENTTTGTLVMGHIPYLYPQALEKIIACTRRNKTDPLIVHMIGACIDLDEDGDIEPHAKDWESRMRKAIDILNNSPNTILQTFDVGQKPHPNSIAFFWDSTGTLCLLRGSKDFTTIQQMAASKTSEHPFDVKKMHLAWPSDSFLASEEHPFMLAFDGRLPMHQNTSQQREALARRSSSNGRSGVA